MCIRDSGYTENSENVWNSVVPYLRAVPEVGEYGNLSLIHILMLLHCKTGGVKHCCFGYIRLKRPLFQSEGVIEGAIVMLVPKEGDSLEAGLMSEISSGLLEDEAFFSAVQKKGRISIIESLEKRLMQYYQKTKMCIRDRIFLMFV